MEVGRYAGLARCDVLIGAGQGHAGTGKELALMYAAICARCDRITVSGVREHSPAACALCRGPVQVVEAAHPEQLSVAIASYAAAAALDPDQQQHLQALLQDALRRKQKRSSAKHARKIKTWLKKKKRKWAKAKRAEAVARDHLGLPPSVQAPDPLDQATSREREALRQRVLDQIRSREEDAQRRSQKLEELRRRREGRRGAN